MQRYAARDLLRRLARVNPTTAFLAALALVLAGLFLPGIIGGAAAAGAGRGLIALTFTTWPVQAPPTRASGAWCCSLLLVGIAVVKIL